MATTGVLGVLLAGGLARRMGGGDKCLIPLKGRPLLSHVIERANPQSDHLIINAAGDPARFSAFDLPVVPDPVEGFAGPLAGILAGLEWAQTHHSGCQWVVSIATDTPFFPADLVTRLKQAVARDDADIGCAASGGRTHPVFGLWPMSLAGELRHALVDEDIRKVDRWTARYRVAEARFSDTPYDPFFNANTPEDIARAEAILAGEPA